MTNIKSMKLYTNVERVYNELAELGIGGSEPLKVEHLSTFDQLHYHGTGALDKAIHLLGIESGQQLLEVGSGIGGPARYLASKTGANITALELQADQNQVAHQLSQRCGLSDRINHLEGDFLDYDWGEQRFDAVVSWLALYHIPNREKLLGQCHKLLKSGGKFYTEDLCSRGQFSPEELQGLEDDLYAISLPDTNDYLNDLRQAGFEIEYFEDMSDNWSEFTRTRLASYRADHQRQVRVHGEATVAALEEFYSAVNKYFQSGKLAGVRLLARKVD
jgi:cyclopropane fatty-acyl-phospholipid synthase-like methyltransferase